MKDLMLVLGWGSPIGIGVFLVCLGGMIFLLSKAGSAQRKKEWHRLGAPTHLTLPPFTLALHRD